MKTFLRLLQHLRGHYKVFFIGLFLSITLSILNPLRPYLVRYIIDVPVAQGDVKGIHQWSMVLLALLVVYVPLYYWQSFLSQRLGQTIAHELRERIFSHLLRLRLQFFDHTPVGVLITRTINDVKTLEVVFSKSLITIAGELLQLFFICGLMLYTDWRLTLVVFAIIPFIAGATWLFKKKVHKVFQQVRYWVSMLNAFVQTQLNNALVIKVFHREAYTMEQFQQRNQKLLRHQLKNIFYYSVFFPVVELFSAIVLAALVFYGGSAIVQGKVSFGVLVAFLMYVQMFFRPIRLIADQFNNLQLGLVSAERIFKLLDTKLFVREPSQKRSVVLPKDLSIVFDSVWFAYKDEEWVLKGISFEVPARTTVAIVGMTGAGKSTLFNLLLRFYSPQKGTIYLNEYPINTLPITFLRKQFGLVLQQPFLFSGTIYENLTLFDKSIPLERVQEVAKAFSLDAFIRSLPGGYDFHVGYKGNRLSLGQRQLIALLRIAILNPPILLLDEATASIDSYTENLLQNVLKKVMQQRTTLVIAHRLSTIQDADNILVMKQGRIVEQGKHEALLKQEGYYAHLYRLALQTHLFET